MAEMKEIKIKGDRSHIALESMRPGSLRIISRNNNGTMGLVHYDSIEQVNKLIEALEKAKEWL